MKQLNCILLIDDNYVTNMLNKILVENLEMTNRVELARSGDEALDLLARSKAGTTKCTGPDLILVDINMPRMNGWEFLDEFLKSDYYLKDKTVIIMLSTSLNHNDTQRAANIAEISEYMEKPLSKEKLRGIMEKYFPETPSQKAVTAL